MNIAVILAGGVGSRVGAPIPKQFIKINNKTILAYTIDVFQKNNNIDFIEIVSHKDWINKIYDICNENTFTKVKWICCGGNTFQDSVKNGIFNLKKYLSNDDIVVLSFGVSPLTPQEDIDDCIKVAMLHGNGVSAKDIDLCTCLKDDEYCSSTSVIRETLKGFANPWGFKYGEIYNAYKEGERRDILNKIEPHTTSLYFYLNKKIWFSKCTSPQIKITTKSDIDILKAYMIIQKEKEIK